MTVASQKHDIWTVPEPLQKKRLWNLYDLKPGHHICLFFKGREEHRETILPYLRQGLERGERVVYISSVNSPDTVERYLLDDGLDLDLYKKNKQWQVLKPSDCYLEGDTFNPERMNHWLKEQTETAFKDSGRSLRITGEMDRMTGNLPDAYRLIWYESRLDNLFPGFPAIVLCQYDMEKFTPNVLKDVLRNHPIIIFNGQLYENFYYVPSGRGDDDQPARAELLHWLNNLEERKTADKALKTSYDRLRDNQDASINLMEDLSREIMERRQAEEKLKDAVREKEVLLMEIHHRVKNNLQIISSLLKLQASTIDDRFTIQALRESQHRIRSMALVHERLYAASDFACIDIGDYISSMVRGLFATYEITGRISLDIRTNKIQLPIDSAIPCGLIMNELVTNALKYAFPDGRPGKLEIIFRKRDDDKLELTVKDNGVGLSADLDINATESLGFQLVKILTGQMDGELSVGREEGTTFTMLFPG